MRKSGDALDVGDLAFLGGASELLERVERERDAGVGVEVVTDVDDRGLGLVLGLVAVAEVGVDLWSRIESA